MKNVFRLAIFILLCAFAFEIYKLKKIKSGQGDEALTENKTEFTGTYDLIISDTSTHTDYGIFGDGDTFSARGFNARAVDGDQMWIYHIRDRDMDNPKGGNQSNGMGVRDVVTHESANMGIEFHAGTPNTYNTCSQYKYPGVNSSVTNKLLVGDEGVSIDLGSSLFSNRAFQMFRDDKLVFAVAETGGMIINGVRYLFPALQALASTQLINDGNGNLTWGSLKFWQSTVIDSVATGNSSANLIAHASNIITAAGAIDQLTLTLPAAPANGDVVGITNTQTINTLAYKGGTVIAGGVLKAVPVGAIKLQYFAERKVWFGW